MENQLDRIEWKLDQILGALMAKAYDAPTKGEASPTETSNHQAQMPQLTTKQHAALQMLLRGADNAEIAERFNVSPNTAKIYVRGIAKKLGVVRVRRSWCVCWTCSMTSMTTVIGQ